MHPKRFKKLRYFGLVLAAALVVCVAVLTPTHQVHAADFFGLSDIAGGVVGWIAYIIIYIVSTLAGYLIALITYLISVLLVLNDNVVNTFAVQSGYTVTLAVANLGFVLAIIVIALATILRSETYGIKKSLWRLVVAAIFVNFSLVIGGAVIHFANSFTTAFMSNLPGSGPNGVIDDASNFASTLAGAFAPQKALLQLSANGNGIAGQINGATLQNANPGTDLATILAPLIGISSAAGLLIVIVIVLGTFMVQLLARYVILGFLLILMPFAWLAWLFPGTKKFWSDWWSWFIRWSFFPPIVVFFLWLAIATAQAMQSASANNPLAILNGTQYISTNNGILAGISTSFGSFIGAFASSSLQGMVVIGLAIGGMYVADKMSIAGASGAMSGARSVGNAVQGYVGKKTGQGSRFLWQRAGMDKRVTERLQTSRIPVLSRAGHELAGLTEKGGKALVKKEATKLNLSSMDEGDLLRETQGARGKDRQLAYLEELQKRGKLHKVEKIDGKTLKDWLAENDRTFSDYKQGKLQSDIDLARNGNNAMYAAAAKIAAVGGQVDVVDKEGIVAPAGTKVKAAELESGSSTVTQDAQEAIDAVGPSATIAHQGKNWRASDLLAAAIQTKKEAADTITREGGKSLTEDEKGLLGVAGQTVQTGEFLRAASEKFYKDKDRSDIAKTHPEQIFGGEAKFGLSNVAVKELGKAITHGIAVAAPTLASGTIGKLDSWQKMVNFRNDYQNSVAQAYASGQISVEQKTLAEDGIKRLLSNKFGHLEEGHGTDGPAPTAPTPTPTGGAPH